MKQPTVVPQHLDPEVEQAEALRLIVQLEAVRDTQSGEQRHATEQVIATMRRGLVAAHDSFVGIRHRETQRKKATRPRGGDDKRTRREIVTGVKQLHPAYTPAELLPHVNSESERNGMKPISEKTLRNILSELSPE